MLPQDNEERLGNLPSFVPNVKSSSQMPFMNSSEPIKVDLIYGATVPRFDSQRALEHILWFETLSNSDLSAWLLLCSLHACMLVFVPHKIAINDYAHTY